MNVTLLLNIIGLAIAALKGIPGIDPKVLGFVQTLDDTLVAANAAHQQAQQAVDPSLLKPITKV